MTFKEMNIDSVYISHGEENIINSLIAPALKHSVLYQRGTAYFSSSVFKLIKDSLPNFIKNNGKIQLIISPTLSEMDLKTIRAAYKTKEETVYNKFNDDFLNTLNELDEDNLSILYQLIVEDILDIKVACTKDGLGLYHDKLGILYDEEGNKISFSGSANASYNAFVNNYERMHVVLSWEGTNERLVNCEIEEFNKIWNNTNDFLDVYNFKNKIIDNIIKVKNERNNISSKNKIELYDYQKTAINNWVENDYKGFFVMATGTGKTWTAIYSAKKLLEDHNAIIVILAPYKHLINQWEDSLLKAFDDSIILKIYSDNTNWKDKIKNAFINHKYNSKKLILISTINSFYSDEFQYELSKNDEDKLLIVDEAHRFKRRDDMIKNQFKYRLGLSATPYNGKNIDAKNDLINFFGGEVFTLTIEEALNKNFLTQYEYHPILLDATIKEEEKFNKMSFQISTCFDAKGKVIDSKKLIELTRNRLRLISKAENKIENIDAILKIAENKNHFIVYCGDSKINDDLSYLNFVKTELDKMNIKSSQFTANEDAKTRMSLIESFNDNLIDSLVAIRCLDEGVDIPSIKEAIILSSNDDYREFVQRRGRILRKYKGKNIAHIYDVILLPSTNCIKMAEIELRRYYEYAKLAKNFNKLKSELESLLFKYNMDYDDIKLNDENEVEDNTYEE